MTIEFNREEFRLIPDISSNVSTVDIEGNAFKLIPVMSFDTNNRPLAGLLNKSMNQLEFYRINEKGDAWKFQKSFMLHSELKTKPKRARKKWGISIVAPTEDKPIPEEPVKKTPELIKEEIPKKKKAKKKATKTKPEDLTKAQKKARAKGIAHLKKHNKPDSCIQCGNTKEALNKGL